MNLGAAFLLTFIAGIALGGVGQKELHEEDQRTILQLCDGGGLGTYFVAHDKGAWQCFYEQPSWPHRIKRSTMVFASGIEGPKPLGPRDRR